MIIGITGTDGAGKGTVVDYLVKEKKFTHYASRALILEHIKAAGLPENRNQMRLTANALRAEHGNEFIIKEGYRKASEENVTHAVIESLRAPAEAEYLKSKGGILLAVDANQKLRFERVQARRSETDKVTYEEFMQHEALESNDPDPNGMQKTKVMQMADYTIMNNGSVEDLHTEVEKFLQTVS